VNVRGVATERTDLVGGTTREPVYPSCKAGKVHYWDIDERNLGRCLHCGAEWQFPAPADIKYPDLYKSTDDLA